jgi:hypothetical protein
MAGTVDTAVGVARRVSGAGGNIAENDDFLKQIDIATDSDIDDIVRQLNDPNITASSLKSLQNNRRVQAGTGRTATSGTGQAGDSSVFREASQNAGQSADNIARSAEFQTKVNKVKSDFQSWEVNNGTATPQKKFQKLKALVKSDPEIENAVRSDLDRLAKEAADSPPEVESWIKRNPGTTVALLLGTGMFATALALYLKKTETEFKITKIENDSENLGTTKYAKITYDPDCPINVQDGITIESTNSDPNINGVKVVAKYYTDTQIGIEINEALKTDGDTGKFRVTSASFLRTLSTEVVDSALNIINPVVNAGKNTLNSIFLWILFGLFILVIIGIILSRFFNSKK